MARKCTVTPQVTLQVGAHDEAHELAEIEKSIMTATASKPCGTPELLIIPDKPNSRLQKYRLTDKGRALQDASMRSAIPVCQKSVVAGCDYFSLGC